MLTSASDDAQLHRQLGSRSCRMRPNSEKEAARDSWYAMTLLILNSGRQILIDRPGDRIVVVVQKQRYFGPENSTVIANKVRRGDIRHAVVVRAKKEIQRPDGSVVRFGDNACVLVNKAGDPIGTRLNG